jgi:NAD(P)-dependent dehydrogenase (short-subunit alcohol dehydrogenase family)
MAIALALIRLGKKVVVATDEVNESVLLAAAAALGATSTGVRSGGPHSGTTIK